MRNEVKKNMEKEFRRGEVYWVTVDDSVGAEIRTGRPAVILSGNKSNETSDTVIVAYMTQAGMGRWSRVRVMVDGEWSQVCCEQIRTIDKSRLGSKKGVISVDDMSRVTGAVANAMCIPLMIGEKVSPKNDDELEKLTVERDMYKRMYEMVMDAFVQVRVSDAVEERTRAELESGSESEVESEEDSEGLCEEVYEGEESPEIDINSCVKSDLVKLGVSSTSAHSIIANRPYKAVSDLRTVPGVTKIAYRLLKSKVVCIVEPEESEEQKLNINTCTAKELSELTGVCINIMYAITGYRKREGVYKSVSELAKVPRLPANFLERFGDKLTV